MCVHDLDLCDNSPKQPKDLKSICINKIVSLYSFFKPKLRELPDDLKQEVKIKANDVDVKPYHGIL
jgi:hypothetical protein